MAYALLAEFGWAGSAQIHEAPHWMPVDARAHQILVGFRTFPPALLDQLQHRFPPSTAVICASREMTLGDWLSKPEGDPVAIQGNRDAVHSGGLEGLVTIVDRLLGPGGCPWDQAQTHESLQRHLLEEAYELIEAIDQADDAGMREELGDVLLQPLMHAQMKALAGEWSIEAVCAAILDKLIRRHPHVFGNQTAELSADQVLTQWEAIKQTEPGMAAKRASTLDGIPSALPALMRAMEVSRKAAKQGFEWPDLNAVWDKFNEEISELQEAIREGDNPAVSSELGDVLFTLVNVARWLQVDAEQSLRQMLVRFETRYRHMEAAVDRPLSELSPEAWDALWNQAKQATDQRQ